MSSMQNVNLSEKETSQATGMKFYWMLDLHRASDIMMIRRTLRRYCKRLPLFILLAACFLIYLLGGSTYISKLLPWIPQDIRYRILVVSVTSANQRLANHPGVCQGNDGQQFECSIIYCSMICRGRRCTFTQGSGSISYVNTQQKALYSFVHDSYLSGVDYFMISYNDSHIIDNWAYEYISQLRTIQPPNIGIGIGNNGDSFFFHQTHINIFGFIYPWNLPSDDIKAFLCNIYPPRKRLRHRGTEASSIQETETSTRYLTPERRVLDQYISAKENDAQKKDSTVKVISMALYGNQKRYVEGALRNAQLAPVLFPGWILRFYVPPLNVKGATHVREPVITTLWHLGAEVHQVSGQSQAHVHPTMWRYLVADDKKVDIFLIQDADSRLNPRLAAGVADWLATDTPFYCMRDHPRHAISPMNSGLWAAHRKMLQDIFRGEFVKRMASHTDGHGKDSDVLQQVLWTNISHNIYCHDSVSCDKWPNSHPWPTLRRGSEYVGEKYSEFHVALPDNQINSLNFTTNPICNAL